MNPRQPPSSAIGQRPVSTVGGRGNAQLNQFVTERMARDELWNTKTNNDLWICPYCLSAIAKRPGLNHLDSIVRHLENCRSFALGKGQVQVRERIAERRDYENLIHAAQHDKAWRVFGDDGVWISPFSLQRVPSVKAINGKTDNFFFQALHRHLSTCAFYRQGISHLVDEVLLARELHRKLADIVRFATYQLHRQDDWRWVDQNLNWICPYTLFAVPQIRLGTAHEWEIAPRAIAQHLITHCPRFATGQMTQHPSAAIAHVAGQGGRRLVAPPTAATLTPMAATQILGSTSRSGLEVLNTASFAKTQTTPIGNPISRGPTVTPLSTTLNSGHTNSFLFSRAPITGLPDLPKPASPPTTPASLPLGFAPETGLEATADIPAARPLAAIRTPAGSPIARPLTKALTKRTEIPPQVPTAPAQVPPPATDHLDWMDEADSDAFGTIEDPSAPRTDVMHARQLQEKMLPQAPAMPGFQFAARFEACNDITGDFFVFISLPEGRVGIALGDVSGHGMQAGLIMSMAKKTLEIYAAQDLGPADTLARVNDALVSDLGGKMFISMVYGVLNPSEAIITWARAGHNPTMRFNIVTGQANEIRPRGMVVGMKSGAIFRQSLQEETTHLESGDVFLLYTDGITETMNLQHEEFGPERLAAILGQFAGDGPDAVVDQVMERMRHFRGPRPAADDATLVALLVE